jgi:hypothetical protein
VYCNPDVKSISDVDIGESVLSHSGEFEEVTGTSVREYNGEIIEIDPYYSPKIRLTGNHPVRCIEGGEKQTEERKNIGDKTEWKRAENLKETDYLVFPRIKRTEEKKITVGSNLDTISDLDLRRAIKMNKEGYTHKKISKEVGMSCGFWSRFFDKEIPKYREGKDRLIGGKIWVDKEIRVDGDFMELLGWYMAEGSVGKDTVYFWMGKDEENNIDRVKELIKSVFDYVPKTREDETDVRISVHSKIISNMFREKIGTGSEEKRIPNWLLYMPKEKQYRFLRGLTLGDGHISDYFIEVVITRSKKVAYKIRLMLFRLGIINSMRKYENIKGGEIDGRRIEANGESYRVEVGGASCRRYSEKIGIEYDGGKETSSNFGIVAKDKIFLPIREIGTEEYSGKVHNLQVENSESYVTKAGSVHNCCLKHFLKTEGNGKESVEKAFREGGLFTPEGGTMRNFLTAVENVECAVGHFEEFATKHLANARKARETGDEKGEKVNMEKYRFYREMTDDTRYVRQEMINCLGKPPEELVRTLDMVEWLMDRLLDFMKGEPIDKIMEDKYGSKEEKG